MLDFKVIVNGRITFIEKMENIKNIKTFNKRVFIIFVDDSENDFYFDKIEIE